MAGDEERSDYKKRRKTAEDIGDPGARRQARAAEEAAAAAAAQAAEDKVLSENERLTRMEIATQQELNKTIPPVPVPLPPGSIEDRLTRAEINTQKQLVPPPPAPDMPTVAVTGDVGIQHIYRAGGDYIAGGQVISGREKTQVEITGETGITPRPAAESAMDKSKGKGQAAQKVRPSLAALSKAPMIEIPKPKDWNYIIGLNRDGTPRYNPLGPRGEALPEGAQNWHPVGRPNFGPGAAGALKSLWWNYSKDVPRAASVVEMTELWNKAKEYSEQRGFNPLPYVGKYEVEMLKNFGEAFSGRGAPLTGDQYRQLLNLQEKNAYSVELTEEEQKLFGELTKVQNDSSRLSGLMRLTDAIKQPALDAVSYFSILTKQAGGLWRAEAEELMRQAGDKALIEYDPEQFAQENQDLIEMREEYKQRVDAGEVNPYVLGGRGQLEGERERRAKENEVALNFLTATLNNTFGLAYNAILLNATGQFDAKALEEARQAGWDSGRILYTQVINPMVRYEYEQRVRNGESPEQLAMELANPWAEMVGEMVFDPLNVIGAFSRGAKTTRQIMAGEAKVAPRTRMLVNSFDEVAEAASKLSTGVADEAATRLMNKVTDEVVAANKAGYIQDTQKYLANDLTAASLKETRMRKLSDFFGDAVTSMKKDGRSDGDIAEIMRYAVMSVSDNADEAGRGIAGLLNSSVPKMFFSELGADAMRTVRGLVTKDSAYDLATFAKKFEQATPEQLKLIDEVEKAQDALKAGKATPDQMKLLDDAARREITGGKLANAFDTTKNPDVLLDAGQEYQAALDIVTQGAGTRKQKNLVKAVQEAQEAAKAGKATAQQQKLLINISLKKNGVMDAVMSLADEAAGRNFASITEMREAHKIAEEAIEKGQPITREIKTLADAYAELPQHAKTMEAIFNRGTGVKIGGKYVSPEEVKNVINAGLGTFYFTINPGTAVKNFISNNIFMAMDNGVGTLFESTQKIQGTFLKHFGAEMGAGETFKSMAEGAIGGGLMGKIEARNAIQVLGKRYRDAFSKGLNVALPFDELKAVGMTQDQFNLYKNFVEQEGNLLEANKLMSEVLELGGGWRTLGFMTPEQIRGFKQHGVWDEILDLVKKPDVTLDDVKKFGEKHMVALEKEAQKAANDIPGVAEGSWMADELSLWRETELITDADIVRQSQYLNAAEQARHSFDENLMRQMQMISAQDPTVAASHFYPEILNAREWAEKALTTDKRALNAMWDEIIRASRNRDPGSLKRAWNTLGINKKMPMVTEDIVDELVEFGRMKSAATHEGRYQAYFEKVDQIVYDMKGIGEELGLNMEHMSRSFEDAYGLSRKSEQIRSIVFRGVDGTGWKGAPPIGTKLGGPDGMNQDAVHALFDKIGWKGGNKRLLAAVNKDAVKQYENWKDIPWDEAVKALGKRVEDFPSKPFISPSVPDALPTSGRIALETQKGFSESMQQFIKGVENNWGATPRPKAELGQTMAEYAQKYGNGITDLKAASMTTAEYWRDFTLLGYGTSKRYSDLAVSYLMPYAFWYRGTYRNMLERLATNPEVIAGFAKYTKANELQHPMLPEWYRQQVNIHELLGVETDNPLFYNLQQTLNPLIGLTGTDFKDPYKRVNQWTATIDDMGKFGPSLWAPIQWATAAWGVGGDEEAARRWAGRALPQSAGIKALSYLAIKGADILAGRGIGGQWMKNIANGTPIEIDPAVLLTNLSKKHPMDPYEEGRVSRALNDVGQELIDKITRDTTLTAEQKKYRIAEVHAELLKTAQNHEGSLWEEAYRRATGLRAAGQLSSPLLGVGFKSRTMADVELDEMYTQMNMLSSMKDGMTPEKYQMAWAQLRDQFPFMDVVLLARRASDERDAAMAYNVMSRIPPGANYQVFEDMGLTELRDRFYNSKGDMSTWTQEEKDTWNTQIANLAALVQVPDGATRQEWTRAKNAYSEVNNSMTEMFGKDIFDRISAYFDADTDTRKTILTNDPEIQNALDFQADAVVNDPELLGKYYGSLETTIRYASSLERKRLADKFGDDVLQISSLYGKMTTKAQWQRASSDQKDGMKLAFQKQVFAYELLKKEGATMTFEQFIASPAGDISLYKESAAERAARLEWEGMTAREKRDADVVFDKQVVAWKRSGTDLTLAEWAATPEGSIGNFTETKKELYARLNAYKIYGKPKTPLPSYLDYSDLWNRLEAYWDERSLPQSTYNARDQFDAIYSRLPDMEVQLRREPGLTYEENIAQSFNRGVSADELFARIQEVPELLPLIEEFYTEGRELPYIATAALAKIGAEYGISDYDMLAIAGAITGTQPRRIWSGQ